MDIYSEIILMEELGYADPSVAITMLIHTCAAAACIYKLASDELKQRYLPAVAKGEAILAFAMTEDAVPGSWSSYIKTTAKLEGNKFVINGRKVFITNAGIADLFVVLARMSEEKDHRGIGVFLVEKKFPGVVIEGEEPSLGLRAASWGTISFENCEVPRENLIMGPPKAFAAVMDLFNMERLGNPSICNGIAARAFDEAITFLSQRKDPRTGESFIEGYQGLQFKIAEMYSLIRASRLSVWHAAYLYENGLPYVKEVSAAKFFANEAVRRVCLEALQLHGGYGYSAALVVEKLLRDGIFGGIGGGTLEVLKLRVVREILKERGIVSSKKVD